MPINAAMFIFLAAAVVSVFAFCSVVVWVSTPSRERQARDRFALLKTLAEQPGDNARQILEVLRQEDRERAERRQREERNGWIAGGLIVMAVGLGLGLMLAMMSSTPNEGTWTVGLIPFLIGCVVLGAGLARRRAA